MRLLCVGRHAYLSEHLCRYFRDLGADCAAAVGANEARHVAATFEPHVVVCDCDLITPSLLNEWATDPNAPFLAWDTSSVTQDELGVVRSFLARRSMLTADARGRLAKQLADRIRPRVPAAPDWTDEQFLVSVVAARTRRAEGVNR